MKAAFELKSTQFRREREDSWRELELLLGRVARRGLGSLTAEQLHRLPVLYRGALSSLSVARAISTDRNLLLYLEGLAQQAYVVVYTGRRPVLRLLGEFFGSVFPATFWKARIEFLLATLFLMLGGATAFVQVRGDLDRFYAFMPPAMAQGRDPGATTEELRSTLYRDAGEEDPDEDDDGWSGGEHSTGGLIAFSSFLFTNNTRVGFLCFALGCIPFVAVFWLLFYNGASLGAFTALFHERGLGVDVWSWLLPHGITELLAVVICGAAGLRIGMGVVFPGRLTRLESLKRRGREAARLAAGCVALFFAAGLIEGIFRQRVDHLGVRYALAGGTALFWLLYLGVWGRRVASR